MAIEKRELGTQDDPDIIPMGSQIEVFPEPSREDMVRDAAMVLVAEEGLLIDDEIDAEPEMPMAGHDENLVEYLDPSDLSSLATTSCLRLRPTRSRARTGRRPTSTA